MPNQLASPSTTVPVINPLTSPSPNKLVNYLIWLDREGFKDQTVSSHSKGLRFLARNCDLTDPESIRAFIASRKCSGGRKENLVDIYSKYAKYNGIAFSEPRYSKTESIPFIPLQKEMEILLDASSRNLREATLLRLLFECGMRIGEATRLQFKDFDFERRTVKVAPEKYSNPRELRLSDRLCGMLKDVFRYYPSRPFPTFSGARKYLENTRKLLAKQHGNPRFLQVHLHTFRHFRATMLYAQTKDILHVKHILGHKSLTNTLRYTHLIEYESNDSFICKIAKSLDEASKLVEVGFEFVTQMDGQMVFRKRK